MVTDVPVSSLIAGSRMLTAEVFAFTTSVARQVAARTPVVPVDEVVPVVVTAAACRARAGPLTARYG